MESRRFQANLSRNAAVSLAYFTSNPESDEKGQRVASAVYGMTQIVGMGAVRVHYPLYRAPKIPFLMPKGGYTQSAIRKDLPATLQQYFVPIKPREWLGDIRRIHTSTFVIRDLLVEASMQSGMRDEARGWNIPSESVAAFIEDLTISAGHHRALVVGNDEVEDLRRVHDRLVTSKDLKSVSLASALEGITPADSPAFKFPLRSLEILEDMM